MRLAMLVVTGLVVLVIPSTASAHDQTKYLFHSTTKDLRKLAIIASDAIEGRGLRYIGAHGTCVKKDRAISSRTGEPGWKHVVCTVKTTHGYVWRVTYHALATKDYKTTYERLR